MRIDLEIDHLRLPTLGGLRAEDLASAVGAELERLAAVYGLPFASSGGIDVDLASFAVEPGLAPEELATDLARQLMRGLHQETGEVPWGLTDGPDAPRAVRPTPPAVPTDREENG